MQAHAKVRSITQRFGCTTKPGGGAFDDLHRTRCGRGDARPLVAGVGEEPFDEGESPRDPLEDERGAVAVLHSGGVDLDTQHQAEHVGDEMAFAALDAFPGVEPHHFARLRAGFDALTVDDRGGRAFLAAFKITAFPVENVMDMRPDPGRDPGTEIAVDGAARRKVSWQHAPPLGHFSNALPGNDWQPV